MPYLLALLSAACFGAADFMGGLGARRAHTLPVVVISGMAGLVILGVLLAIMPAASPGPVDFVWGGVAGLAGGIGLGLLFQGLSIGKMSIVAPTTAVCGVTLPVIAAFIFGERPAPLTLAGMALALVAVVLVSQESGTADPRSGKGSGIGYALLAGVAIGFFYLALAETSEDAGLWPLVASRGVSVGLYAIGTLATGRSFRMDPPVLRLVLASGAVDMLANALYVVSTWSGPLSVVVVLSSLYPAGTVVLARLVLHERLSRTQLGGIACAMLAVAMIVGGS